LLIPRPLKSLPGFSNILVRFNRSLLNSKHRALTL
jgi:hypothetical protein